MNDQECFTAVIGEAEDFSVANFGWVVSKRRTFFIKSMKPGFGPEDSIFAGGDVDLPGLYWHGSWRQDILLYFLPEALIVGSGAECHGGTEPGGSSTEARPSAEEAVRWRFVPSRINQVGRW